jgi:hypothetical protein
VITRTTKKYSLSEKYNQDAIEHGGGADFMGPAALIGFTDANDPEQNRLHAQEKRGDGSPAIRVQKNRKDTRPFEMVSGTDKSVNAMFLVVLVMEGPAAFQKMADCLKRADDVAFKVVMAKGWHVRSGAQGKKIVPAIPVVRRVIHATDNGGGIHWHIHRRLSRYGVTATGKTLKLGDLRQYYRIDKLYQMAFQAALGKELAQEFKWNIGFNRGVAVVQGVPPELMALVGKRSEQIKNYLESKGIEPTPQAKAYAALNTRTCPPVAYTRAELVETWKPLAGQALLQHGRSQGWIKDEPSAKEDAAKGAQKPSFRKTAATVAAKSQPEKEFKTPGRLQRLLDEFVVLPLRVIGAAVKVVNLGASRDYRVKSVPAFLDDIKKRSRPEAHRAAIRSLYQGNPFHTLREALLRAEYAYQRAREPHIKLKSGDRVVLSKAAATAMTSKELQKLRIAAEKHNVAVYVKGQDEPLIQSRRQERRNRH